MQRAQKLTPAEQDALDALAAQKNDILSAWANKKLTCSFVLFIILSSEPNV